MGRFCLLEKTFLFCKPLPASVSVKRKQNLKARTSLQKTLHVSRTLHAPPAARSKPNFPRRPHESAGLRIHQTHLLGQEAPFCNQNSPENIHWVHVCVCPVCPVCACVCLSVCLCVCVCQCQQRLCVSVCVSLCLSCVFVSLCLCLCFGVQHRGAVAMQEVPLAPGDIGCKGRLRGVPRIGDLGVAQSVKQQGRRPCAFLSLWARKLSNKPWLAD